MRGFWLLPSLLGAFSMVLLSSPAEAARLQSWQFNDRENRLTLTTDEGVQPRVQLVFNPTRLVIDLPSTRLGRPQVTQPGGDNIQEIRVAQFDAQTTRFVIELKAGYTLDPQQILVRGTAANQWVVQLPEPQADPTASSATTPLQADTQLEEVRITPDGFYLRTQGDRPDVAQVMQDNQFVLDLNNTALSPQLTQRDIPVDRYGVHRIQLVPSETDPAQVRVILDLAVGSPRWQATNGLGGLVLVPVGGLAAASPENRTSASLTPPSAVATPTPVTIPGTAPPASTSAPVTEPLPSIGDRRLTVVLDPGHGGRDPGAVGIDGLQEKDVVLDIGLTVAALLREQGVRVILTRQDDREIDLEPRVSLANRSGADLFVSIHANAISLSRPDVNGIETYYYGSGEGRTLARTIQDIVTDETGMRNIRIKEARFYVIRYTSMPATLVEVGFVTGRDDAPRLADPDFRDRIATGIARGILQYVVQHNP